MQRANVGDVVAVTLENFRPPNIATVLEVNLDTFKVQWLKEGYNKKWTTWPIWPINHTRTECDLLWVHFGRWQDFQTQI